MIKYTNTLENIKNNNIKGFFVDWPNPPSPEKHIDLLNNSTYFWLAVDDETSNVIGFITAISDNTLSAYIPLLEVLPEYKSSEIGSALVKLMLKTLKDIYMVDLICDENLTKFYKQFNMFESHGMILRNFHSQSGK